MGSLFAQSSDDVLADGPLTSSDWLWAGSILLAAILVAIITSKLLRRAIAHGLGPGFAALITSRLIGYAIFLVGLFYALTSLGVRVGPLLGALGLGGLVLALALQRVVENFVASVILQARRPFTVGDTVKVDGHVGIVADVDSRVTLLQGLDGTQIRIPNASVTGSTIINLTREPIRRSSLSVGVAYDSDLQAAADTLAVAVSRVPRVLDSPPATVNLDGFGESSIGFTILYWHGSAVPAELAARHDLVIAVHQALADAGITIAFPQMVLWTAGEPERPYDDPLAEIQTPYPGLDQVAPQRRMRAPRWRRSGPTSPPSQPDD